MVGLETILKWNPLPTPLHPGSVTCNQIVSILKKMILKAKPGWYPASLVLMLSLILGSEIWLCKANQKWTECRGLNQVVCTLAWLWARTMSPLQPALGSRLLQPGYHTSTMHVWEVVGGQTGPSGLGTQHLGEPDLSMVGKPT